MCQTFIWEILGTTKEVWNTTSEVKDTLSNKKRRMDIGMLEVSFIPSLIPFRCIYEFLSFSTKILQIQDIPL